MPKKKSPQDPLDFEGSILRALSKIGLTKTETLALDDILTEKGLQLTFLKSETVDGVSKYIREPLTTIPGLSQEESDILNRKIQDLGLVVQVIPEDQKAWKEYFYKQKKQNNDLPTEAEKERLLRKIITGISGEAKTLIEYFDKTGQTPYTIDLPGLMDILKVPLPDKVKYEYLNQMIKRLKSRKSPVPDILDWIPGTIRSIDDAQDLIFTLTIMARFVAIKVAPKALPYIGWSMAIQDVANIATAVLATPLTGAPKKGSALRKLGPIVNKPRFKPGEDFNAWRARLGNEVKMSLTPSKARARALQKVGVTSIILQGGQAMETVTGYGIQLGAIMGLISDSVWGVIRTGQGADVRIRPPLEMDPLYKPAMWLLSRLHITQAPSEFDTNDYLKIMAADLLAVTAIAREMDIKKMQSRVEDIAGQTVPVMPPQDKAIIDILMENGLKAENAKSIAMILAGRRTTLLEELHRARNGMTKWITEMHERINNPYVSAFITQVHMNINRVIWQSIMGEEGTYSVVPEAALQVLFVMLEHSLIPVIDSYKPSKEEVRALYEKAQTIMNALPIDQWSNATFADILAKLEPRIKVTTAVLDNIYLGKTGADLPEVYRQLQERTAKYWGSAKIIEPGLASAAQIQRLLSQSLINALANKRTTPSVDDIFAAARSTGLLLVNPESLIQEPVPRIVETQTAE